MSIFHLGRNTAISRFIACNHFLYSLQGVKDAYGIFKDLKGMDTTIERDEDRVTIVTLKKFPALA